MPRAEINGAELNYELAGEGPAVVLVHEGVCDLRMWDELVPVLAAEFTVLRYDMRGYGESTIPPGPFSQSRDALGLMDHVGLERAALVGVSYGGRVALDTAFVAPDRVTALVLASAGLRDHEWSREVREFGDEEERLLDEEGNIEAATDLNVRLWVDGPKRGPDPVREQVRERVRVMQQRAFEVQVPAYEATDRRRDPRNRSTSTWTKVRAPALVVVGDADVPDFVAIGEKFEAELPDARLVVLPDTAHTIPLERPDEFREADARRSYASARPRSSQRASTSSRPTLRRTRPGGTRSPSQRVRVSSVDLAPPSEVAFSISRTPVSTAPGRAGAARHVERHQAAEARVADALDGRVGLEPARELGRARRVPLHPHLQRAQAA